MRRSRLTDLSHFVTRNTKKAGICEHFLTTVDDMNSALSRAVECMEHERDTMSKNANTAERDDDVEMVAVEAHPRAIRWMHWLNFPILSIMIWSGLRIYWSFDFTRVVGEFGDNNLIPNDFYDTLQLDRKLARGLSFHFSFGWLFVINGLFYVGYLILSKEGRHIVPRVKDLKNIFATLLHDVGLRDKAPEHGQYNVIQQIAYTSVLIMAAIVVATGFAIFKPTQLAWLTAIFGGYESARAIHLIMTVALCSFFLIHIIQVVRSGFGNFWSMISGYELRPATLAERVQTTEEQLAALDNASSVQNNDEEELENV